MSEQAIAPVYFLLVDDREENLTALEALLRREGLVILKARTGPEALEILLKKEVALALLDVQMPEMDGFELAELMRGTERTRRVPIIFLTAGIADQRRRFRGYEAGAVDFIQKPLEPDVIRSKAEVFFDLYRQRQEVARLLTESRAQGEALREADRRKDEFLATLAHELRNPLAPIRTGLHILKLSGEAGANAVAAREMMERQLGQMVRLIDDLLDVSRISQGKVNLRTERVQLCDIFSAAIEASRPHIDAGQHELSVRSPKETLALDADPTRLAQVIANLLNNAAKYTPQGGKIELSGQREGDDVVIRVKDTGVGIPPELLPRVFDMFTQVDRSLERAQGGLGIGLSLVKRLVEMHGGKVTAESQGADRGSTFVVRLPAAMDTAAAPVAVSDPNEAKSPSAARRVVIADDNVDAAESLATLFELMGNEVRTANDGAAAVETVSAFRPDVALLDIGMPKLNGYDACRQIREQPGGRDVILIAMTGWGQDDDRRLSAEAGFDRHLVKPVDLDALQKLLAELAPK